MRCRFQFSFKSFIVATAIVAVIVLPAVIWLGVQDVAHMQVGNYIGEDEWRVWTVTDSVELRIHHPKSSTFWKRWPIQVRGPNDHYR